ncbi:hypothetical protein FA95DRAFT_1535710 [Auriscalpium vulgare]|uniref:Uncharacterized protein n=1 Tax=Auriscalpium vulgare TaxID=40419 RepID=A0ACB8S4D2_9AGAM|nr:hypothetical protein FA95DRAFT_1535710 [Auriscalpium vulgare]
MPSDHVLQLCASSETVTAALAKQPNQPVSKIVKELFGKGGAAVKEHTTATKDDHHADDLQKAERCGKFPSKPSELFLKIYNDVLTTLDSDPLAGLVSPSLLASSGVIPLSIVSVIPDIMRHYADLIVRAEHEVFLATNYWEPSHSAAIVADSIRELSKRVGTRGDGRRVVVKLMYDRGNLKQVVKNHVVVPPAGWSKVGLPEEHEIPGVQLEVVNYHRPALGTFHAKYMVVDRKVACLNSNNIQDRPNVEMMVHLEGPIVESFYDMALLSWSNALNPPLPLLSKPPTYGDSFHFKDENNYLKYIDAEEASKHTRGFLRDQHAVNEAQEPGGQAGQTDAEQQTQGGNPERRESMDSSAADQRRSQLIADHPNMMVPHQSQSGESNNTVAQSQQNGTADSGNAPSQQQTTSPQLDLNGSAAGSNPLALDDHTRTADADLADAAKTEDHRITEGDNGAAEIARRLNIGKNDLAATVEDGDGSVLSDFRPHILHEPHAPCPIAMVNRNPTGTPGHEDVMKVPQNVAWLSALKYAQKSVFVQTPTFNASPVVPATLDACRRGVEVTLYLDLGFNDQGEMIPFQGGTNEEVVNKMYKMLNEEGKGHQKNLKVFWYTSKDQKRPISAAAKKRNCHVKFMCVDDQIAILGNGNQDTQSWFHSQEINVLVDSPALVAEWLHGINANQNTLQYGRVSDTDGVWREGGRPDGEVVQASGVATAGMLGRLKGLTGAVARVRGTGGF